MEPKGAMSSSNLMGAIGMAPPDKTAFLNALNNLSLNAEKDGVDSPARRRAIRDASSPANQNLFRSLPVEPLQRTYSQEENAARKIQSVFRSYAARQKLIESTFLSAWKVLDIDEENQIEKQCEEIDRIHKLLAANGNRKMADIPIPLSAPALLETKPQEVGEKLNLPITLAEIDKLRGIYQNNRSLARSTVIGILNAIYPILEDEPNLKDVKMNHPDRKVVIVGDLHGQLPDLFTILSNYGPPCKTKLYIFNGDFVDRGPNGLEVLMMLYCLKLYAPKYVHLNRGNHEHRRINLKYNFQSEVTRKYDAAVFSLIQDTFNVMPLCARIHKKIFIVHGGLTQFTNLTIKDIKYLDRKKELPRHKEIVLKQDLVLEQLLWSDPIEAIGIAASSRGAGVLFGPDVTYSFLTNNKLSLVIRSHEMAEEGFAVSHRGALVTIFSASNYCGCNTNKGAVIVFDSKEFPSFTVQQYYANLLELGKTEETSRFKQVIQNCKNVTVQMLKTKIYENRHALLSEFTALQNERQSEESSGIVTRLDWVGVMNKVLKLPLPWLKLQPYLAIAKEDGTINYLEFLDRYKVKEEFNMEAWKADVIHNICAKLYSRCKNIFNAFKEIDANADGKVTYEELVSWVKQQDLGLTDNQIYELMRHLDTDKTGTIDLQEFVQGFQVDFAQLERTALSIAPDDMVWLNDALEEISLMMHRASDDKESKSLRAEFRHAFKKRSTRTISHKEFSRVLKHHFGKKYTKEQRLKIADLFDLDHNGFICWDEFKKSFKISSKKTHEWMEQLIHRMCSFFFHNSVSLRYAFQVIDSNHSGKIDINEFSTALAALNITNQHRLSDVQIKQLFKMLDKNGDGQIEYDTFLQRFQVVDTEELVERKHKKKENVKEAKDKVVV